MQPEQATAPFALVAVHLNEDCMRWTATLWADHETPIPTTADLDADALAHHFESAIAWLAKLGGGLVVVPLG